QPAHLRRRRADRPVHRDQGRRHRHHRPGGALMRAQLLAALRAVLVFTVLVGLAYPLVVTGLSQLAFHDRADGSLVHRAGQVVGSSLLGQSFTSAGYFQGRPSAAGDAATGVATKVPGDLSTAASGASNLGPTNKVLLKDVADRIAAYRKANDLADDA